MSWVKESKDANKWKSNAEESSFFGQPIKEMGRDELLAIIGYFSEEQVRSLEDQRRTLEMWKLCREANVK